MTILYSNAARKALKRLDASMRGRILEGVKGLEEIPPEGDIKPLKGADGLFRLRIGNWRIVFSYPNEDHTLIERIAPRGEVYKGRL